MYKETISIEAQLKKIVDINPEYGELWSTWNLNKKTLEPILSAIIKDYPHYSFHDHSHSESILLNIGKVLGNEDIEKLSPTDLWLLLHVAYLHDFGMVILDTKINEVWSTKDFQEYLVEQVESEDEEFRHASNVVLSRHLEKEKFDVSWPLDVRKAVTLLISKYCRWQHGEFTRNYVLDIKNVWGIDLGHNGLIKNRLVKLIAEISAIHTKPFESLLKLHKEANGVKGDYVHPRLIASLLRLGDVLDLDNGRFNFYGEKIFGEMPKDSKLHYEKHESTRHILINSKCIEVEADCPNDDVYRETRRWYDSLKNEIENMHLNWSDITTSEFTHPPKLMPYKILRNGIEDSNELTDLKFEVSQNKAFEILEGASIYKDKFSCVREIVQNAEDATKIQLWRDIKSGMYYSTNGIDRSKVEKGTILPSDIPEWIYQAYDIKINIERNEENDAVLTVADRGTGISLEVLKSICNVGQSYYQKKERKKEVEEMPVWLRPTANFGVGLQSCFMVTDKITIYTRSNSDESYKITFKSGKQEGYVNVEKLTEKLDRGSKVSLTLKNELNFSYNILGYTAKKLMKIEPFESNCVIIYKIIDTIFQECDSSFFTIDVLSESVKFNDKIVSNMSKESNFPKDAGRNGALYSLDKTNGVMRCWYNNNLYNIALDTGYYGGVKVKFKGKEIHRHSVGCYGTKGLVVSVNIYGLATKNVLSLNREKLSLEGSQKINVDLKDVIEMYLDLMLSDIESIKDNTPIVDAIMLVSWNYDRKFPTELYEFVSKQDNIEIVTFNEISQSYVAGKCSLYDIVQIFPKVYYFDGTLRSHSTGMGAFTEGEFINLLNNGKFDKSKFKCILIDNELIEFLKLGYSDVCFLDCDKEIRVCIVRLDDELFSPEHFTKMNLIQKLVYHKHDEYGRYGYSINIMRRAIPAFNDYASLAVKLEDIFFMGRYMECNWYIISPISLDDCERIEGCSREAFIEYVMSKPVFNNIVDYVVRHSKLKGQRNDVIGEYSCLIGEFYDVEMSRRKR